MPVHPVLMLTELLPLDENLSIVDLRFDGAQE